MAVIVEIRGQQKLESILRKVKRAVETGGRELTRDLGFQARNIARQKAPKGVRPPAESLQGSIMFKTMKTSKGNEARVWVQSRNSLIGLANEFGVKPRLYDLMNSKNQKLADWVRLKLDKDPAGMGKLLVGGSKTRLGRENRFWKPSFNTLQKQFPKIAEKTYARRIKRAFK